jgi:hypothetical protein
MLVALGFAFRPYFYFSQPELFADIYFSSINNMLILMGIGISFSTLQDVTKTQNKFSRKIYENPKKARVFLRILAVFTALVLLFGVILYFLVTDSRLKELSVGAIVLGIGLIGMLKVGIEMAEYHGAVAKNKQLEHDTK